MPSYLPIKIIRQLAFLACIAISTCVEATHLRGGEITVKNIQCSNLYEITVTLYTNTASTATPGGATLLLGDGTAINVPVLPNSIIDAQYSIGKAVFVTSHVYAIPGSYLISYSEGNRNTGILNFQNSGGTAFYVETRLVINPGLLCNNPVRFTILPVDRGCAGVSFSHNPGAQDLDGDSLTFELGTPMRAAGQNVAGYLPPNNQSFYPGFNYQHANEAKDGAPSFSLNAHTGTLVWDAPGIIGQFEVSIKVTEWKRSGSFWINMGYVVRDIQIIIEDCPDTRPTLKVPIDVCVTPGTQLTEVIRGFDADFDPVTIEVFTSDNFPTSAPVGQYAGLIQSTKVPNDTAKVRFKWNITCDLVRDQPYIIVFKVTDSPLSGIHLSSFYTWKVTVIGAAPEFQGMTLDLAARSLKVEWKPYPCAANAPTMEIWRRVGNVQGINDQCGKGLPRSLGFVKIGSVSGSNFFLDKNIDPGAKYCYRLLALFVTPHSDISQPSIQTCIDPIVVNAPVITKVSVVKTDLKLGDVQVQWTSPFQIDKNQFPPPYKYEVYRTTDSNSFVKIGDVKISDTTLVDHNLNTRSLVYGYKIVVYSPNGLTHENPVDTSSLAFFPKLKAQQGKTTISLQWNAEVPWSNQSQKYPYHYIYRSDGIANILIDSVDVNSLLIDTGFEYTDKGTFKNQALKQNIVYRYKVQTRGVYGNPKIKDPLQNFSNESEIQIEDKSPPCRPVVSVEVTDCEKFIKSTSCDATEFKNKLRWDYDASCGNDVSFYRILFKGSQDNGYTEIGTTTDVSYIHTIQNSFSGCYKLSAVDRSGNVGPLSDSVCNENCPNIFIPNVFTPANNDGLNDLFPGLKDAAKDPEKCPRFITYIDITVYNRWGQTVFEVSSPYQSGIKEWNGLDSNGKEVASGVYFYEGNVAFDMLDKSQQVKKMKGWVNLIR